MRQANGTVVLLWPLATHILTQGMYSSSGVWHGAIDMRCNWDGTTRQPVYASEDGTVNWVQTWDGKSTAGNQSYGNAVKIRHADYSSQTLETRYAHLSGYVVKKGQTVKEGQLIGYTGNTGKSSGAHLHFEVILGGVRRNPLVWLDGDFSTAWNTVYTYGPGEGPVERKKEETHMTYTSDTLKIGPVSTGDRKTVTEYAGRLGAAVRDEGDYLVAGPMSEEVRDAVAAKARELSLGCADYQGSVSADLSPVMEKLSELEEGMAQVLTAQKSMAARMEQLLDKLSAAGTALE